ncbi:putative C6 and C2H2 transcription factor RegA-like [Aspergillus affinis]|uniref:putative C6 and C2H2 transcription factor RegA-like n=1 Tax=Aspergillus affinis TaxID=1070780 RepID=UPI0022FE4165|nr:uncharacterized protein KD926_000212 [Aspergillus affinis]KAI9037564.1 hypothetical protein KD926_000212 [Aspergillus affinis]
MFGESPSTTSPTSPQSDLMKRHAAGHDSPDEGKRKRPPPYPKNGRVSQACAACAKSKLKCDEEKPCKRCKEKGFVCDWPDGGNDTSPSPAQASHSDYEPNYSLDEALAQPPLTSPTHDDETDMPDAIDPAEFNSPDVSINNYLPATGINSIPDDTISMTYDASTISPIMDHDSGIFSIDGTFFPNFIPDSLIPTLARNDMHTSTNLPHDYIHDVFDHNVQFGFDLTDVDFGLIDFFNTRGIADASTDRSEDSGIALGAEAYRRSSLSNWTPAHEDTAFANQGDLSVPKSIDSPEANMRSERQILSERLSSGSRDLIFGMVLQTSTKANLTRIMKSFPSTELLDSLIQDYFDFQSCNIDSWIHGPTFQPNDQTPDILAAVAAAGAIRSPIPTIRKLGYALMEVARLQLSSKYENDNSTTRDLRASQTFALTLEIGIWSGNGRRTEIAESFQNPLITMMRRSLRFRRSAYSNILPSMEDSSESLERKWRTWTEQESFKRLAHHLFLHDAQSAMMLNVTPILSYAELELPFPAVRALWDAKSADAWRDIYLRTGAGPSRLPSLVDTLHDMSELSAFRGYIDLHLSTLVLLHGLSALINEYHRLKFISKGNSKHWNALVINSRQQELSQILSHFRMLYHEFAEIPSPQILLIYEMISMFLYMSLEELQLFAGKEDKKEARRVYQSALEWINSLDSRRALWHAGQVLRAAKTMPSGSLTGFFAVGVYYASLAFWSYSVVYKAKNAKKPAGSPPEGHYGGRWPTVFLDGSDSTDVQKFISLGCGCPALQGPQDPVLVSDPSQTMALARGVLRAEASHDALPPLVQSLCQLMGDLGNAARSTAVG